MTYGLGSENENLPGFVVMLDNTGGPISGPKNWSSGYMPAAYQGVQIRADKTPIHDLALPPGTTREQQRDLLDRLKEKNEEHLAAARGQHANSMARIASYELAFKMQQHAPEAVDFSKETEETQDALRHRREADRRLRPQVPARPAAGRARRALHPDLLRRQPQRRQLGRPRATW